VVALVIATAILRSFYSLFPTLKRAKNGHISADSGPASPGSQTERFYRDDKKD
jgi:hypothetical protein